MKYLKIHSLILMFGLLFFACGSKEDKTETKENLSPKNSQPKEEVTVETIDDSDENLISCEGVGELKITQTAKEIEKTLGKDAVKKIQMPDGEPYEVTFKNGSKVLAYEEYETTGKPIERIEIMDENLKLTNGVKINMTLKELNQKFKKPLNCTFNSEESEIGGLYIEDIEEYPCMVFKLDVLSGYIGDVMPASLKNKGKFKSNDPELLKLNPSLFQISINRK
jgi:hypothetical protein